MIIPNIWENKNCSKPPTGLVAWKSLIQTMNTSTIFESLFESRLVGVWGQDL